MMPACRRKPIVRFLSLVILAMGVLQSCSTSNSLKKIFVPENVTIDSLVPKYLHNVSQIKYWDRISSANRATNFAWWDSTGQTHEMFEFWNRIVVLNFFSTWSAPAMQQLAVFDSIRADTNVLVLLVAMKEGVMGGKAVVRLDSIARARGITPEVLVGSRDFGFTYGGIDAVPTTFVLDYKRKTAAEFDGFVTKDSLLKAVNKAEGR